MEKEELVKHSNLLLMYVLIYIALASCASVVDHKYFDNTLGLNVKVQKKSFDSSDAINSQGEGFSIQTYTFEDNGKEGLFIDKITYPKTYEERKGWKILQWQNTPLKNEDVLGLLFKYDIKDVEMKDQLTKIEEALKSTDNYFSYYYKDYHGEIYSVDICIVDVKNKKIYLREIIT